MWHAYKIFTFGLRYLRRYRGRFLVGILCGLLYAGISGGFVGFTGTLAARFTPQPTVSLTNAPVEPLTQPTQPDKPAPFWPPPVVKKWGAALKQGVDPWLPR